MIRVPAAARHTRADAKGVVGYARRRRCALVASSSSEPRPGEPGKYLNRGSTTTCGRRCGLVRSRYVLPLGVVMKRTLFGHHITHHQVATIPLRGGTSLASDSRCTPTPDQAPDGQRPIVIGVCGTDRSRWAVEHAARAVGDTAPLYLVSAVRPTSPVSYQRSGRGSAEERRLRDALRDEGYLLTDLAVIHEVQRHAREIAHAAGARTVHGLVRSGAPAVVLAREARDIGAAAVVLGCGSIPTQLARRLCATGDLPVVAVPYGIDASLLMTATPRRVHVRRHRSTSTAVASAAAS